MALIYQAAHPSGHFLSREDRTTHLRCRYKMAFNRKYIMARSLRFRSWAGFPQDEYTTSITVMVNVCDTKFGFLSLKAELLTESG